MAADTSGRVPSDNLLTDQKYWDDVNAEAWGDAGSSNEGPREGRWSRLLPSAIARAGLRSYMDVFLWERLLPEYLKRYLGQGKGSVLEMGAAPGKIVLEFARRLKYTPYGLEYTPSGAAAARRNFVAAGFPEDHILCADMFDRQATQAWESRFDVVISCGLIEHFSDPGTAVAQHLRLVRPGGLVVVTIPTLTGLHWAITKVLRPELLPLHNLELMNKASFRKAMTHPELEVLHLEYEGGPNLMIAFGEQLSGWLKGMQELLKKLQFGANVWANLFGRKAMPGAWMNSQLVAVARRK
jgi:SAM-dependent methyltransferase